MLFLADCCCHELSPRSPLLWPEVVKAVYLSVDNHINSTSEYLKSTVDGYNAVLPSLARMEAERNFRKAADKLNELARKKRRDPSDDFPSPGEFSDAEIYAHAKSIKTVMEEFLKKTVLSEATRSKSSKFIDKWFQATFTIFKSNVQVLSVIPNPYLVIANGFMCLIEVSTYYHTKDVDFLRFHISCPMWQT